jgi:hypothetical protein
MKLKFKTVYCFIQVWQMKLFVGELKGSFSAENAKKRVQSKFMPLIYK